MQDLTLKVFFVMTSGQLDRLERFAKGGYFRRILTSYAYKEIIDKFAEHLGPEGCSKIDVFVDSGAFTVMTKGITIDIAAYADYLTYFSTKYKFNTIHAFNLDVIPEATKEEIEAEVIDPVKVEAAAQASWKNYLYLTKERGFDFIVPVFHYGEKNKWLKTFVDSGCTYFAFGGVSGKIKSTIKKKKSFEELFKKLEGYGYKGRVHMLGLCMPDVLCSHGWYSVDATITKSAGYGHIYLFDETKPEKVKVVPISPTRPGAYNVMAAHEQDDYLATQLKKIGMGDVSLEELGHPDKGFWLRVEACFRSWSLFEDWVNSERRRLNRPAIYNVEPQGDFEDLFNGCDNG